MSYVKTLALWTVAALAAGGALYLYDSREIATAEPYTSECMEAPSLSDDIPASQVCPGF